MGRLAHDHPAAREALADVVVGVADEVERDAVDRPGAEALPGDSLEADAQLVGLEAGVAMCARYLTRKHRAGRAVGVADRQLDPHRFAILQRGRA